MNPILAGVALAVVAGAVIIVSVRDARVVVLGGAVVLLLSSILADPMATPVALAARAIGARPPERRSARSRDSARDLR